MAEHHGKDSYFSVGGDDLTEHIDNINFPESTDVADTSTMGSDAKTFIEGQSSGTISISGKWDETVTTGPDAVLSALKGAGAVAFEYGPAGDASGAVRKTGLCIRTSYAVTSPLGDVVAFTADFQVTGPIVTDVFPA